MFPLSQRLASLKDEIDVRFANLLQMKELLSRDEYEPIYNQIISEMVIMKEEFDFQLDKV